MSQYRIRSLQPKEVYQLDGVNLKILTAIARQLDLPDSMIPLQIPYPFDAIPWRLVDDRTLAQLSEDAVRVLYVIGCEIPRTEMKEGEVLTADGRWVTVLVPREWTPRLTAEDIGKRLSLPSEVISSSLSELVSLRVIEVEPSTGDITPGSRYRIL